MRREQTRMSSITSLFSHVQKRTFPSSLLFPPTLVPPAVPWCRGDHSARQAQEHSGLFCLTYSFILLQRRAPPLALNANHCRLSTLQYTRLLQAKPYRSRCPSPRNQASRNPMYYIVMHSPTCTRPSYSLPHQLFTAALASLSS